MKELFMTKKMHLYDVLKASKQAGKIVVISHFFTETFDKWSKIFSSDEHFRDYELFRADEVTPGRVKNSKKYVLIISAQMIKTIKKWRTFINKEKFDIVKYDDDSLLKIVLTNESYQTIVGMEEVAYGIEQRMDKFPNELIGYDGVKKGMETALGRNFLPPHCREVFERAINENFVR